MKNIFLALTLTIIPISSTYATLNPIEGVLTNKNPKSFFYFSNSTKYPILYEMVLFERSPTKEGRLSERKKVDFSLPAEYITISPKKFVLKKGQGQRMNYVVDAKNIPKLDRAMYLIGTKFNVNKLVDTKEDKKTDKMIASVIGLVPQLSTSIVYLNLNKESLFNKVTLVSKKFKDGKLTIEMKKDPEIFALGTITISHSKDGKKWNKVYFQEERFFIDKVERSYSIPKEIKSGTLKIEYKPIDRYKFKFDKYFSEEIKI